eukprot:m.484407 g.484407  ORF g.484407 m.484407 type:complete len:103 (-) comp68739_c0_seq1:41-349(-)
MRCGGCSLAWTDRNGASPWLKGSPGLSNEVFQAARELGLKIPPPFRDLWSISTARLSDQTSAPPVWRLADEMDLTGFARLPTNSMDNFFNRKWVWVCELSTI